MAVLKPAPTQNMDEAQKIRAAVESVAHLRQVAEMNPKLGEAVAAIKQFQARRFANTYHDLARAPR